MKPLLRWLLVTIAVTGPALTRDVKADCDTNSATYKVCASWQSGDPIHGVHFVVTFDDPAPPEIELITQRNDWTVYVQNAAGNAPASMDVLFTTTTGDFIVELIGPSSTAGAVNVGSIDLTPGGDNYGSLIGSHISRNLTGDLSLQADPAGAAACSSSTWTAM